MTTPIYPTMGKEFRIASEGQHAGVLAFIEDLGIIDTGYEDEYGAPKMQHQVRLFFILDEQDESGAPISVNEDFNLSCFETAKLFQMFRGLGITITPVTDLNDYIGQQVVITIGHNRSKKGKTYANILHPVLPASEDQPFIKIPQNWAAPRFTKHLTRSLAGSVQDGPTIRPGLTQSTRKERRHIPHAIVPFKAADEDIPF